MARINNDLIINGKINLKELKEKDMKEKYFTLQAQFMMSKDLA